MWANRGINMGENNCIRCSKKLSKEECEIDTGNLCEDCRKVTINEDYQWSL
jgi:hypothetical protein